MGLEFKDIGDWTPSTISIVDVPYHPLAYFEVYENDEEFVKKFKEIEVHDMPGNQQNSQEGNVTMSEGFFEKLFGGLVSKRNPEPTPQDNTQNNPDEVTNAQILEAMNKFDERLTAIENEKNQTDGNPQPNNESDPTPQNGDETDPTNEGKEDNSNPSGENPIPQTVELPLNPDGTLNLEDGVVAIYLPKGNGQSQALDVDLTRGSPSDKSLNERTGRSENGMNW